MKRFKSKCRALWLLLFAKSWVVGTCNKSQTFVILNAELIEVAAINTHIEEIIDTEDELFNAVNNAAMIANGQSN
jgi:diacylglycerol kinase